MTAIKVKFSDACSDVLVFLADAEPGVRYTAMGIALDIAPDDAERPVSTVLNALSTLRDCGLVEPLHADGIVLWQATDSGRTAVAESRAFSGSGRNQPGEPK